MASAEHTLKSKLNYGHVKYDPLLGCEYLSFELVLEDACSGSSFLFQTRGPKTVECLRPLMIQVWTLSLDTKV